METILSSLACARWFCLLLIILPVLQVDAFPESQNPFTAGPSIPVTGEPCRLVLFQNASLNAYSRISRFPFHNSCTTNATWDRVVLHVQGHVAGVQYDRVGALWVNGVEVLRMTTPEPTADGIAWEVERDVTTYASLFSNKQDGEVQLQIPNNVNKVYTGVIYLSAQVLFWPAPKQKKSAKGIPIADLVTSLTNPTQHPDAWSSMAISGSQPQKTTITLPPSMAASARRAHIDLYASAHGCEEFWYTNPPNDIAQDYGMCGGGSTRAIQVWIDGQVAGIQHPFPVVYTGGINPLLWRPQTGIYSFNIPPYVFDISPFLGILGDGKPHILEVKIVGNSVKGQWNLDPVLVVFAAEESSDEDDHKLKMLRPVLQRESGVTFDRYEYCQRGPNITITNTTNNLTWTEVMESELVIETTIAGNPTNLSSKFVSSVTNSLVGDSVQVTSAQLTTWLNSSAYHPVELLWSTLAVTTDYQSNNFSFQIDAEIDQRLAHFVSPHPDDTLYRGDSVVYFDAIMANATYNRSTSPDRKMYVQRGSSHQYTVLEVRDNYAPDKLLLRQDITAKDGYVTAFEEEKEPQGGEIPIHFCSQFDVCSPLVTNATNSSIFHHDQRSFFDSSSLPTAPLVRHPRLSLAFYENIQSDSEELVARGEASSAMEQ